MRVKKLNLFLIISLTLIFIWSVIKPFDLIVWFLEVLPVIIGAIILARYNKELKFSSLIYFLLWLHAIILIIGGHYTYAENPLFNRLKITFDLSRNYYDRVGHFFQGFVPAIVARDALLKRTPLKRGGWLNFIIICVCLAISAVYELIEWLVAVVSEETAEAFLGTQGDIWDTQWDMFLALAGSILALILLSRLHDKFLVTDNTKKD